MSIILDYFTEEKNVSTTIKRFGKTFSSTTGRMTEGEATITTVNSIFYVGSQAENLIAEKLRESADGVSIVDPGTDVQIKDILEINGDRYNVIFVDDIALRGEAILLTISKVA